MEYIIIAGLCLCIWIWGIKIGWNAHIIVLEPVRKQVLEDLSKVITYVKELETEITTLKQPQGKE